MTPDRLDPATFDTGFRRSPADHRDYSYRERVLSGRPPAALPASWRVDARTPLPVYDQGSEPSCLAWATAAMKTVHERKDQRRTLLFDGAEFYRRIALPGGGAYFRDALREAKAPGVNSGGRAYPIGGYAAVNPRDHDAVRHAIYSGRGVMVGFMVTREWAAGGGREFTPTPGSDTLGGHGMLVTGYSPAGPLGHNSWGESWGDKGRAVLPWSYWDEHVWECWTLLDVND